MLAIWLPAAMICLTGSGALAGRWRGRRGRSGPCRRAASCVGWRAGAGVGLAGQRAQGVDVGGVDDAVDGALLGGLELLDRLLGAGAELAVEPTLKPAR